MNTITNYTIKSELGQGGMATVYLAEDKKILTNVAVKVLAKEFAHNENIRKRFLAEARNMFKMSHPNIIKVTDLIEEGDTVAFVMEYIEGETLKDYLERKGKLNDEEIKTIFTQMLAAVGYVHEQGLIHRDIKPSNFMINPNGQVKLLDFGIAKNTNATSAEYTQTSTSQQMGTPMYMSPEQVNETKSVTAQSDIYSLGVMLWQMVMGQKPYDTKTLSNFQLQSKIVNENLALTNTNWDTSIQKATHKNIDSRYTSAQLFLTDIQNPKSIKDDKTILEKTDNKTILENKDESTIIENNKTQTITPKVENAQPTSNSAISHVEKARKQKRILLISISILIFCLISYLSLNYYKNNQLEKGTLYYNEKDYEKAFNIFNSYILQENAEAQFYLGKMYKYGQYVEINNDKAFLLAKKSADQENDKGVNALGNCYEVGVGTQKDINKAIECYTKATKVGNAKAYVNLGDIYYEGAEGIERDYNKAIEYYSSAINNANDQIEKDLSGKPENNIGRIYYDGGYGVNIDYEKARDYFLKAIEKNSPEAPIFLGFMYEAGKGVTQDFTQAFKYYAIGANLNNSFGQSNLGLFYLNGRGCIQDDVKAFELFKKSAEQGNAGGLANLGYMYESNRGGAGYDIDKAYMYYKQAADLGNEWAKTKLLNR
jgi:serine/threonine protein kinase